MSPRPWRMSAILSGADAPSARRRQLIHASMRGGWARRRGALRLGGSAPRFGDVCRRGSACGAAQVEGSLRPLRRGIAGRPAERTGAARTAGRAGPPRPDCPRIRARAEGTGVQAHSRTETPSIAAAISHAPRDLAWAGRASHAAPAKTAASRMAGSASRGERDLCRCDPPRGSAGKSPSPSRQARVRCRERGAREARTVRRVGRRRQRAGQRIGGGMRKPIDSPPVVEKPERPAGARPPPPARSTPSACPAAPAPRAGSARPAKQARRRQVAASGPRSAPRHRSRTTARLKERRPARCPNRPRFPASISAWISAGGAPVVR